MNAKALSSSEAQFKKMTETPIPKLIVGLAIPTTISMMVTSIYNMADTYFVGEIGTSASGAIGIIYGLMSIIQAFGFMFGHGAGSIISRKLGAKDTQSATRFASTSFFSALLFGLVIAVFGLIFIEPLCLLLGSTVTILPYAKTYATFILCAAPFMAASCVMNNILRYEGRAMFGMIGMTSGGVLNIFLDALFMRGFGMGVDGAGLATAISQVLSFCLLLYMFMSGKTQSRMVFKAVTKDFGEFVQIIKTGFPSLIRQGLSSISTMMLNGQAGIYGDAAVAAMAIVNRITFLIFSVALGIGQGFQPVSAFNYGAKKYSRVKKAFYFTWALGTVILSAAAIVGLFLPARLIEFFRDDPAVVAVGTLPLILNFCVLFFQQFGICSNMLFQSIGKNGTASFLAMMRSGLFFIPIVWILPKFCGLTGVQIAQPLADLITCVATIPFVVKFMRLLPKDDGGLENVK